MNATAFSNYLEQGYYRSDGTERWGAVRVVSIPEPWNDLNVDGLLLGGDWNMAGLCSMG